MVAVVHIRHKACQVDECLHFGLVNVRYQRGVLGIHWSHVVTLMVNLRTDVEYH